VIVDAWKGNLFKVLRPIYLYLDAEGDAGGPV